MLHHKCHVMGKNGDCLRACIASILSIPDPLDVPNFVEDGRVDLVEDRLRDYLRTHNLSMMLHAYFDTTPFEEILLVTEKVNPGIPFLLFCNCRGSGVENDHCIIIKDGAVLHDPAIFRSTPYRPLAQNNFWVLGCLTPILD